MSGWKSAQDICNRLVTNDASFTVLSIDLNEAGSTDDAVAALSVALGQNKFVEEIQLYGELTVESEESLTSALWTHPTVKELTLECIVLSHAESGVLLANVLEQNQSLRHLTLQECFVDLALAECLSQALTGNALDSLTLNSCEFRQEFGVVRQEATISRLVSGLKNNRSLKELSLDMTHDIEGQPTEILDCVSYVLQENSSIQKLELELLFPEDYSALLLSVARAATGHKSLHSLAITIEMGNEVAEEMTEEAARGVQVMLRTSSKLRELTLGGFSWGTQGARLLAKGLQSKNSSLEMLSLSLDDNASPDDFGSIVLSGLLQSARSLKTLDLDGCISNSGARALAEGLKQNTCTIKELQLDDSTIEKEGVSSIAEALRSNQSVRKLTTQLFGAQIEAFVAMLTVNTAIEEVSFGSCGDLGDPGLMAMATHLPDMSGLKVFTAYTSDFKAPFKPESIDAFAKALERNTTLEHFETYEGRLPPKISHLLTLNRGGRRILASQSEVPQNYWQRLLANSSDKPDVLFYFLREKHDVLIPRTHCAVETRKRKRDSE